MRSDELTIDYMPSLRNPRLVMGFSGWMDGGEVSTGSIRLLGEHLGAKAFASIDPDNFYIYNFPGTMETTSLFRPSAAIEDGIIVSMDMPLNTFWASESHDLVFFLGKEPNLRWKEFADCMFKLCAGVDIREIYFVGSVAGLAPHTRQPRISGSVSDADMKPILEKFGIRFANYSGPAGFATYMMDRARRNGLKMATLVATIPVYIQGNNPSCIEGVLRHLAAVLNVHLNLEPLRELSDEFERRLTELLAQESELLESIRKLEQDYDNEIFDVEMGDMKDWLQQKGIRLD